MLTSLVKYCGYFRLQTLKKINIVHYGNITCLCNRKNNMSTCTLSLSGHKYKYKNIIWHQFKGRSVHNITLVVQASWDKVFLHKSNSIPDVKFLDHLIGWTLTNAGKVTLNLELESIQTSPWSSRCYAGTSAILWSPTKVYLYLHTHTCNNQPPPSTHKMYLRTNNRELKGKAPDLYNYNGNTYGYMYL